MTEKHYNNIFGTVASGAITLTNTGGGGDNTATFAAAPNLPTITAPDIAKIIVEPDTPNEEIIFVTAYTAAATTATVTRAQEGTTKIAHTGTAWVHGPTAANVSKIVAGTNVTTSDDGMGNVTVNASGGGGGGAPTLSTTGLGDGRGDTGLTINSTATQTIVGGLSVTAAGTGPLLCRIVAMCMLMSGYSGGTAGNMWISTGSVGGTRLKSLRWHAQGRTIDSPTTLIAETTIAAGATVVFYFGFSSDNSNQSVVSEATVDVFGSQY